MEVIIIGFSSALLISLGGICALVSLNCRIRNLEDRVQLQESNPRILTPGEVNNWKSTIVHYPINPNNII